MVPEYVLGWIMLQKSKSSYEVPRIYTKQLMASTNKKGQVIYKLKKAYDNGTTQIVLDPLDFLSRLASLVPKPRVNLTRFHGVFAPNFKHRSLVVPVRKEKPQAEEKDKAFTPTPLNCKYTKKLNT